MESREDAAALATARQCPRCGYSNADEGPSCSMCGEVLQRSGPPPLPPRSRFGQTPAALEDVSAVDDAAPAAAPSQVALGYLVLGAVLAPVFGLTPFLRTVGWFLSSLFHEAGHTTVAWFFGMPAFPAIRLDGHAASIHRDQVLPFALAIGVALAALTWSLRRHRTACIALGAATLAYPVLAFTPGKELFHLLGGHGGELAFATICFWRGWSGGFTRSSAERLLYMVVGWYLSGRNAALCFGLAFRDAARDDYLASGSFGLTNDYIRVAGLLHWPFVTVALTMLVVSLLPLPIAWWIWRRRPA